MVFCDGGAVDVVPVGGGASWVVLLGWFVWWFRCRWRVVVCCECGVGFCFGVFDGGGDWCSVWVCCCVAGW